MTTTHALLAVKVQREGEQWCCWIGRSQIIFGSAERSRSCHRRDAEQRTRNCSNRGTGSELRISDAGAQTRIVSGGLVGRAKVSLSRDLNYMAGARIPEIAVGTLITERPPHRTERAPFGHSAPTSGT